MVVQNTTKIAFDQLREYNAIIKFGKEHPDWKRIDDTSYAYFVKEESYYRDVVER